MRPLINIQIDLTSRGTAVKLATISSISSNVETWNVLFVSPTAFAMGNFNNLKHIPHSTLMDDPHYYPFSDAFHMVTTGEYLPTFKTQKEIKKCKLHLYATIQNVTNAGTVQ